MAAIRLEKFQGLIPRSSDRLLPNMSATEAKNTKLLNGELRGYRALREAADFTAGSVDPVRRAFRVRDNAGVNPDTWLTFNSRDVDVVRSPLVNDTHDRYYWAGDGRPKMNTYARIYAGSSERYLGIPTPGSALSVVPPAGTDETRAYVYTFVSAYGEEGPPSPPTVASGKAGTWALSGIDTTVPDAVNRDITHVNIYRTVSGGNSSNFYFVAQISLSTATYDDLISSTTVAANNLLESTSFIEPPTDMEGVVVMPNGYLVGWAGRRLLFSEPYRPHAWPAEYELSTEFPITGLVVWGSTLVVGTESQPYFGQGNTPAAFTTRKLDAIEPCLSRRGMVATVAGAYYPSINGLVLLDSTGAKVITQDILTKEEWESYSPASIYAAQLGLQYIAFTDPSTGFLFNPTEPDTKLIELEGFDNIEGVETDRYSGNVLLLGQNRAWDWDPSGAERLNWRWQSKRFQTPEPVNFGAARLQFNTGTEDVSVDIGQYYGSYNSSLFAAAPSGTAPSTGDPNWSEVQLLAKFEGNSGATAYTELSQNAAAAQFRDRAQIDTAESNQGSSSVRLTGDAEGFYGGYIRFPYIPAYDLGTSDWTIEGFCRFFSLPLLWASSGHVIFEIEKGYSVLIQLVIINEDSGYRVKLVGGGYSEADPSAGFSNVGTISGGISVNTWYHFAVTRTGGNIRAYFNGNYEVGDSGLAPSNMGGPTGGLVIGCKLNTINPDLAGYMDPDGFFNGHIDDVRMTIGTARYTGTGTYTVPTTDFPEQGGAQTAQTAQNRGLNTINGHAIGGKFAQARGLVKGWTEPENRQPLGGSLLYPEEVLSFQTLAVRFQIKTGRLGEVRFDKVIYNDSIFRLPTGFKDDLWQFNLTGNTDVYSLQVGTTPRALKQV